MTKKNESGRVGSGEFTFYILQNKINLRIYIPTLNHRNQSLKLLYLFFFSKLRGVGDLFKRALMACYLLKILEMTPFFYNGGSDPHNVKLVDKVAMGAVLLRHLQNLPCNAHEVTELELGPTSSSSVTGSMSSTPRDSTIHEIGAAAFSTLSLINHSCDPNVVRHYYS